MNVAGNNTLAVATSYNFTSTGLSRGFTVSGVIQNAVINSTTVSGGLTITGSASSNGITLGGSNTFTGGVTVTTGIVTVANNRPRWEPVC